MSKVAQLKKKAADLELKKQFDKALAVYVEMLELYDQSPEEIDLALFNRVGDLLLKQGKVPDALNYYERAVDLYTDGGFHNNAIALCNKILRQSPGRTSIYYKLGKISAQKGFKSDAKRNYLEYADRMQKGGRMDEAFRALKEFADLCPDQEDIRLMLADQLSKQSRGKEAVDQLQTLYDRYQSEGRDTEARATLDRMKAIDPAAQPRRASGSVKASAGDLVFLDLDEPIRGTPAASAAAAPSAPAPPPAAPPKAAPAAPAPPPPEREPEPFFIEPPAGLEQSSPQTVEPVAEDSGFEFEASAPFETMPGLETNPFGDVSGAAADIQPMEFEPTSFGDTPAAGMDAMPPGLIEPTGADSLMGEVSEDTGAEQLGGDLDLIFPDAEEAPAARPAPQPPRRPSADDAAAVRRRATQDLPLLTGDEDIEPPAAPPQRPSQAAASASPPAGPSALDLGGLDLTERPDPVPPQVRQPPRRPSGAADAPFQKVSVPPVRPVDEDRIRKSREVPAFTDADILDLPQETHSLSAEAVLVDITPATIEAEKSVDVLSRRVTVEVSNWGLRREYAEALLESGAREEGLEELDRVMVGMERADDLHTALDVADEVVRSNPDSVRHHQKRVEYAFRLDDRSRLVEAYLALADALFRSGTPDKARAVYQRVLDLSPDDLRAQAALSTLATPTPAQSMPAQPDAKARPASAPTEVRAARPLHTPTEGFVNLGDWLREDEGPRSTRMVVDEEEPSGDEEADFADMLKKFKQGVAQNVEDEDHQSHYDLGIAYKEMGLVDEAIAEFQKALRGPVGHRVPTYEALGQCFIEKEQYPIASAVLSRALSEPGVSDEQLIGVLYLLGLASEGQGKMDKALEFYQRVFVVDIQFRDVAQRIMEAEQARR